MDDHLRKFHIRTCISDALSRHAIASDSPLRGQLEANATISAGDTSLVIMKNGNSLDVEIENRLSSPRMNGSPPTTSCTVAKSDAYGLRKNFDDIAAGKVRVE